MLRANTIPREIIAQRVQIAGYLKRCREVYLISKDDLVKQTKLRQETIRLMEGGKRPWTIDTMIRYLLGVIVLAKQKRYYDLHAKKYPECSEESIRKFLNVNIHNDYRKI